METGDAPKAGLAEPAAMETEVAEAVPMETELRAVKKPPPPPPVPGCCSGLPQSPEELKALIASIQNTVNNSVLPRLHKCLNAKVHAHTRTHTHTQILKHLC